MRVLVDTSIWIDHLNSGDNELAALLMAGSVVIHPFIKGEIMLGSLKDRRSVMALLNGFRTVTVADHSDVLTLIDRKELFGSGIGYVDAHLVASATLTAETRIWTRDRRLSAAASRLAVNHAPLH